VTLDDIQRYHFNGMALVGVGRFGTSSSSRGRGEGGGQQKKREGEEEGRIMELRDCMVASNGLLYMSFTNVHDTSISGRPQATTPQTGQQAPNVVATTRSSSSSFMSDNITTTIAAGISTNGTTGHHHRSLLFDINQWLEWYGPPTYPYRVIGLLQGPGTQTCTGALIGPNVVGTAAHCLYDGIERAWQYKPFFLPGMYVP